LEDRLNFTQDERQTLANLGFLARTTLVLSPGEIQRFLAMDKILKADTIASWAETDKAWIISVMRAIPDHGYYWRELIERFAAANNVALRAVAVVPVGAPAPTPTPVPAPPATDTDKLIAQLEARVKALETSGAQIPAGAQIFDGDVIFRGRVGFGGLNENSRSKIQVINSSIHLQAANGEVGAVSISGDGGVRFQQNGYFSVDEYDAYDPDGDVHFKSFNVKHANPAKPWVNFGPDGKGDLSYTKDTPGTNHEYTQDWVFRVDETHKEAGFFLYRPGFKWIFGRDSKYGPETFWSPDIYVSRG
jgi:hypothetical protein